MLSIPRLFVGGLPPDTTNLEMYQIFSAFGPIAPRGATWNLAVQAFGTMQQAEQSSAKLVRDCRTKFKVFRMWLEI